MKASCLETNTQGDLPLRAASIFRVANLLETPRMKTWFLCVFIVVLIVLILLAWRKESLSEDTFLPPVDGKKPFSFRPARKAKKLRASHTKEEKWRDVFETITGYAYPTTRPFWLVNPNTSRRLELDGYSAELGSAFEYNGRQHYEFPNSFHKTQDEFDRQVERDALKVKACREMGVDLVVIPHDLTIEDAYEDIKKHLLEIMKRKR